MPRLPRIHAPGSVLHVLSRGNRRQDIFEVPSQWPAFLDRLAVEAQAVGVVILAYCLMPNHFHLLLRLGPAPLSQMMHRALTFFATNSNRLNARSGHVFQGRYKSFDCKTDAEAQRLACYIHNNPVRAGLVGSAEKWRWSSHRAYLNHEPDGYADPSFVLSLFHEDPETAVSLYRKLMLEAGQEGTRPAPAEPLEAIAARVEISSGLMPGLIRSKQQAAHVVAARDRFVRMAAAAGHSGGAIAAFLGRDRTSVFRALRR
ncbi:MAG: transposase [Elusimicrobia bacterium]|nr:transposase [Elusimicrobiota bacterium]